MEKDARVRTLSCRFCTFKCYNHQALLKHTKGVHEHDPNFLVCCSHCGASYRRWDSLRKHVQRDHGENLMESPGFSPMVDQDDYDSPNNVTTGTDDDDDDDDDRSCDEKWDSAMFLLHLTHELSLTHDGVNVLSQAIQSYTERICETVSRKVEGVVSEECGPLSEGTRKKIHEACHPGDLFEGLKTRWLREKYYEKHFNYTEPKAVVMGTKREWKLVQGVQKLVTTTINGYTIDFLQSIRALMSNPAVKRELLRNHNGSGSVMRDYRDGSFFKNHQIFQKHQNALQVIVYYDDIEVGNPLGSRAGVHKLGCFYFTLGNIRPEFRSSLRAIHLLAIAYTSDIREYGCAELLKPFVNDMNLLGKDEGHALQLENEETIVHGAVVCFVGDTPASNFIAGFKEGVGFSLRKCRMCLATKDDISRKFHGQQLINRDQTSHNFILKLIEADKQGKHSTTYGINSISPLADLKGFDVTKCFPYDIMHSVFEGVACYHLANLLKYLITDCQYLTLDDVNHCITSHSYGYSEVDTRPTTITKEKGSNGGFHISESASQMMTLIKLLPLMIGDWVHEDDEHWDVFLILWEICSMVLSFEATEEYIAQMEWIIELYLESYTQLYGRPSITPKMHHLVHLPKQMTLLGPLRLQWCMRFESKNAQIKHFVNGNFKNVPLSAAIHHQQWMCRQLATRPGQTHSNYLYAGDEATGDSIELGGSDKGDILSLCDKSSSVQFLKCLRCNSVKVYGKKYSIDAVICFSSGSHNDARVYGVITDIYIYEKFKIFKVKVLDVIESINHYRSIKVKPTETTKITIFEHLMVPGVMHLKRKYNSQYITDIHHRFLM